MACWLTIEGEVTQNEYLGRIRRFYCHSFDWNAGLELKK